MRRSIFIGILVTIAAVVLALGAAAGAASLVRNRLANPIGANFQIPGRGANNPRNGFRERNNNPINPRQPGRMMPWNNYGNPSQGGRGRMMNPGYGMMNPGGSIQSGGQRISMDDALKIAQSYASQAGSNFLVKEVMEFQNNFYAAVIEKDSGRGAFELLINPANGATGFEPGPNMMWNQKYGHMRQGSSADNSLTLDQATSAAQKYLDANVSGAVVQPDGIAFYGYYTFDYKVNDQVAGMLSVNGTTGEAWLHTWHGQFISEKEVSQ